MLNPIYSLLTQNVALVSQRKSKLTVKPEIQAALNKFVLNEEQALVCLLTLFYSHYYKDLYDQPKSYDESNLVVNTNALNFINSTLSSTVVDDIKQLMTNDELSEFTSIKCYLDKFAYLIKTLVIRNA